MDDPKGAPTLPYPITMAVAKFAAGQRYEATPAEAFVAVRMGISDLVGCMIAGLVRPAPNRIREALPTLDIVPEARLYLGSQRAASAEAAAANAAAAAVLDFDDVALRGSHPSSVLASVLLAEGDRIGASGKDVLTAYAVGFEVWARIVERESDPYIEKGWHTTAVIGTVAGAVALGNLHRLNPGQIASAIGLAAAAAGGLTASFGSWAKNFQVGLAAQNAVTAARLAAADFTGGSTAIEARNGLLVALSPKGRIDLETPLDDLGRAWRLESGGLNLKKYPMALATHRALDGLSQLAGEHRIGLADVAGITLFIGPDQEAYRRRLTPPGRFSPLSSVELGLAAILSDGRITLDHLEPSFHERPDIQAFMKTVDQEVDPAITPDREVNLGFAARLQVRLGDGRILESRDAEVPRGNWRSRMSQDEQWQKFSFCTSARMSAPAAETLFGKLQALDAVGSVHELTAA